MTKKRVFISFVMEDVKLRDLMVGQSKNPNTPFEFVDMSIKKHGIVPGRQTADKK